MRKRDSTATVGCQASEARPVNHGENLLLRSSAPTFSRVGSLQDPDADDPHGSLAVGVVGGGDFSHWMRISNLGLSNGSDIHSAMSQPWLPPGGSSRRAGEGARVKKRILRILFLNFRKYSYFPRLDLLRRKAPSVTLRVPPPSRREARERHRR